MATTTQVRSWIGAHNGKWIDFDGAYGAQCMDLVVQYAYDLWGHRLTGNAEALRTQPLPAGWQRIKNSATFKPQLGDIFVWYGAAHPYGHTGVIISGDLNRYEAIEQNIVTGTGAAADRAQIRTNSYPADFWGVVRPPISQGTPPTSNGGAGTATKLTPQRGTFKANGASNIRRAPSTKTGAVAAVLSAGQTVKYDNIIDADGWRWVSYIGNSGARNYIAVRRLSDNWRTGICY